jgi:hypothetical protein
MAALDSGAVSEIRESLLPLPVLEGSEKALLECGFIPIMRLLLELLLEFAGRPRG